MPTLTLTLTLALTPALTLTLTLTSPIVGVVNWIARRIRLFNGHTTLGMQAINDSAV